MRVKTLQIIWNGKEPVFSVDFHSSGLLASAGSDKEIKVSVDHSGDPVVKHIESLGGVSGHSRAINCVRFSPSGKSWEFLASAGDGGEVILWRQAELGQGSSTTGWRQAGILRGHADDVWDLSWSPDSTALVSASSDNECNLFSVAAMKSKFRLNQHKHLVQGVAWDPAREYILSASSDKTVRWVGTHCLTRELSACKILLVCTCVLDSAAASYGLTTQFDRCAMFHDESIGGAFFRRLAWSPDGAMAVMAAGQFKKDPLAAPVDTAWVYARGKWAAPIMHLPSPDKAIVAVRFCPPAAAAWAERETPPASPIRLPYNMVFAIATMDSVMIYETQNIAPIAVIGRLHYAPLTDLAWSPDGAFLAISSQDNYCRWAVSRILPRACTNGQDPQASCLAP
eukprot:jgi/Astpho2/2847/e_gw1.00050.118.1_t